MIPKKIHYCWFGYNQKPQLAQKCIESWKKKCPEYEIIEWNEENFDIYSCPLYVQQAYESKMWAFVTDYARLKIVYENGGIYMDTDVELKRSLNSLLKWNAYFGFEDGIHVATGLGFGAEIKSPVVYEMMKIYDNLQFKLPDGTFNMLPCPKMNTTVLLKYGLKQNNRKQIIGENILILPSYYLCPLSYSTGEWNKSFKMISIHWFSASWKDDKEEEQRWEMLKRQITAKKMEKIDYVIHIPNRIAKKVLGEKYEKIKLFFKGSR